MGEPSEIVPFNTEAELIVLACACCGPSYADLVMSRLASRDFYYPAHSILYGAMRRLHEAGTPLEIITIRNALLESGELADIGGQDYLLQFGELGFQKSNLEHYARMVYELSGKRQTINFAQKTIAAARNGVSFEKLVSGIEDWPRHLSREAWSDDDDLPDLSTYGIEPVSWLWEGYLRRGHNNLLEGRGGDGKSTAMVAVAAAGSIGKEPMTGRDMPKFRTLYLGRQDAPGDIHAVLKQLGGDAEWVIPYNKPLVLDSKGLAWLERTVRKYDVGLVIFDPTKTYFPPSIKNEFDNINLNRLFDDMREVAAATDSANWLVRHFAAATMGKTIDNLAAGGQEWRNSARTQTVCLPHPDKKNHPRFLACFPCKGSMRAPYGEYFAAEWSGGYFGWVPSDAFDVTPFVEAYPAVALHLGIEAQGPKGHGGATRSASRKLADAWLETQLGMFDFARYSDAKKYCAENKISHDTMKNAVKALQLTYDTKDGYVGWRRNAPEDAG